MFNALIATDRRIILLLTAIFGSAYFILGPYSVLLVGDEADSVLGPLLGLQFVDGARPLWNPFSAGGTDMLALGYAPDLDRLLFQTFPAWIAYALRHLLQIGALIAGVFLLSQRLGQSRLAAATGAILAGGYISTGPIYYSVIALMPLGVVVLTQLFEDKKSIANWGVALIYFIVLAGAGQPHFLIGFPVLIMGCWFVAATPRLKLVDWAILAGFFLLLYAARLQDYWALFVNGPLSQRADWPHYNVGFAEAFLQGTGRVWRSINPLYLLEVSHFRGVFQQTAVAAVMILAAALIKGRRSQPLRRCILALILMAGLEILMPVTKVLLFDIVPPIRGFSIDKLWWMCNGFLFVGAGFAIDRFKPALGPFWQKAPVFLFVVLGMVVSISFWAHQWATQGSFAYNYQSPSIEALAERAKSETRLGRIASYQMYAGITNAYGLEDIGGTLVLVSRRYNRFWLKMIEPSFGRDKYADDYIRKYGHTMNFGLVFTPRARPPELSFGARFRLNMLSLANVRYILSRDRLTDPDLTNLGLHSPDNPWNAMDRKQKLLTLVRENFTGRKLYVYENTKALNRYFFVSGVSLLEDEEAVFNKLADSPVSLLKQKFFMRKSDAGRLADSLSGPFEGGGAVNVVRDPRDGGDSVVLKITPAPERRVLFASLSYSPFWKCAAGDRPVPLLPGNHAFWAIPVPAGAKTITCKYKPPYTVGGDSLSAD